MAKVGHPLKWHGGKAYLAERIIALMPPRCKNPNKPSLRDRGWLHYVETHAGGLSVLLANDPEGISEAVNDTNQQLTNFWQVIQDDRLFGSFQRRIMATPFSDVEFEIANTLVKWPEVEAALRFFVLCRQSLAGRMKGFTGITKTRTRRGMNNEVSAWLTAIDGLPAVHERLKRVLILNRQAIDVIREQDGKLTLFYLDPPYLHETRATTTEFGAHEMDHADHVVLLERLAVIQGRFMLSGYRSKLYDHFAKLYKWKRHDFPIANHAAGGKTKRRMIECVWCNF